MFRFHTHFSFSHPLLPILQSSCRQYQVKMNRLCCIMSAWEQNLLNVFIMTSEKDRVATGFISWKQNMFLFVVDVVVINFFFPRLPFLTLFKIDAEVICALKKVYRPFMVIFLQFWYACVVLFLGKIEIQTIVWAPRETRGKFFTENISRKMVKSRWKDCVQLRVLYNWRITKYCYQKMALL